MMASPLPGEPSTQPAAGTALRLSAVLESSSAFAALRSFAASEYLSHPVQFWYVQACLTVHEKGAGSTNSRPRSRSSCGML